MGIPVAGCDRALGVLEVRNLHQLFPVADCDRSFFCWLVIPLLAPAMLLWPRLASLGPGRGSRLRWTQKGIPIARRDQNQVGSSPDPNQVDSPDQNEADSPGGPECNVTPESRWRLGVHAAQDRLGVHAAGVWELSPADAQASLNGALHAPCGIRPSV